MDQALSTLVFLGVGIVALALILVGILAGARSRHAREHDALSGSLVSPESSAAAPARDWAVSSPAPEPIRVLPENDGTVTVEVEGRRFGQLGEIVDERQAARVRAAAEGLRQFVASLPDTTRKRSDWRDEVRVGRLETNGALVIELGGRLYRQWADMPEEAQRKLTAWLGELAAFAPQAAPDKPSASLPRRAAPAPEPIKRNAFLDQLRGTTPKPSPMPVGIAGQVEQILQQQLLDNSTLHGWSIHVVTEKNGSLAVEVEGRRLHWPDGVPDGPVREAVQKAIRVWETSF